MRRDTVDFGNCTRSAARLEAAGLGHAGEKEEVVGVGVHLGRGRVIGASRW